MIFNTQLFAALFLTLLNTPLGAEPPVLESQLIGKWMGHRHFTEFLPGHVLRWDGISHPGMAWRLEGRTVVEVFPDVPGDHGMYYTPGTTRFKIVSLSDERLVGLNSNGYKFVEYRVVNDTPEAREAAAARATEDQDKLKDTRNK
jgi:hypothetical protein